MFDKGKFSSRVVSMTDHERGRRLRPLRLIETYWQSLADEAGNVPMRDDVDPRGIQDALEYAFLAERITPSIARLRVAGSHMSDLMGMEVAGLPLSAFILPDSRNALADGTVQMFSETGALHADLVAAGGLGRPPLRAHLLMLPLRSESGAVDRVLGGFLSVGQIGRVPRRFDIEELRVTDTRIRERVHAATPTLPAGLAEDPAPFRAAPREAPSHPHLRLVVSND